MAEVISDAVSIPLIGLIFPDRAAQNAAKANGTMERSIVGLNINPQSLIGMPNAMRKSS